MVIRRGLTRGWLIIWLVVICLPAVGEENLVANGDFEAGEGGQPQGWSILDGLVTKWGEDGNPGRCLRLNTAVLQAAKSANEQGLPPAGKVEAKQGERGQYATVGAHEGAWAFAAPIEVTEEDRYFIIETDWRGPRSTRIFHPQIFLRGFQRVREDDAGEHSSFFHVPHADGPAYSEQFGKQEDYRETRAGDYLMVWRKGLFCRLEKAGEWQHFRMAFKLPGMKRFRPDRLLVKPYAMWPLGKYDVDNVVVRRCDKAEYDRVRAAGHSAKAFR